MESSTAVPGRVAKETVIEPAKGWSLPDLRELWERRDLLYFMARRDVATRYKQAMVGAFWAILQPLFLAAVFSVFFGLLANVQSEKGIPYPLFVVSGFIMWLFFANALQNCTLSTIVSGGLISKVYFPRLVIPIAALVPPLIDFLFGFFVVLGATLVYGFDPTLKLLLLPALLALALTTVLGAGLWLSALNVKYRDVVLLVPFMLQVGMFITPVVYPVSLVPENLQPLYAINPTVGILELYRWILLPTDWPGTLLILPVVGSIALLVTGAIYFKRAEQSFADVI